MKFTVSSFAGSSSVEVGRAEGFAGTGEGEGSVGIDAVRELRVWPL